MKNKYLFVISFDGLSSLDFDFLLNLKNFKEFIKEASYCRNVKTIYPSLTYPAHASIVTGKYPKNHKVINNTLLQVNKKSPDWKWQRKYIKSDTIYDIALKNGKKVASILWPVTAKSKITYNMPEIFPNRKWQNQIITSAVNGSLYYQFILNKKFGHLRDGLKEPNLGNFAHSSVLYTIKKYRPDMLLAHYIDLDTTRHKYGFYSKEAFEALKRHDEKLGEIVKTLKDENLYEDSTIVLLGDHSSIDVNNVIFLNSIFYKKGYITMNKNKIIDYKVIAKNCDGSSYIYVKDKNIKNEIEELLFSLKKDENMGIEEVFNNNEVKKLGADTNCSFMVEAKRGYYFKDKINNNIILNLDKLPEDERNNYVKNCHGYLPTKKDYNTMFFISGDGIKKDNEIKNMNLIDIAPTISKLFKLNLKNYDGKIVKEIFI